LDVVQVQPVFVAGDDRDILAPECVLMSRIKDLFRQSPFDPLRDHMVKVMECVGLVRPMFEAVSTDHHENLEDITKNVFKKEHEADILKDEIRQTIPKTFYVPVFRGGWTSCCGSRSSASWGIWQITRKAWRTGSAGCSRRDSGQRKTANLESVR
jgi:hypothetical protein